MVMSLSANSHHQQHNIISSGGIVDQNHHETGYTATVQVSLMLLQCLDVEDVVGSSLSLPSGKGSFPYNLMLLFHLQSLSTAVQWLTKAPLLPTHTLLHNNVASSSVDTLWNLMFFATEQLEFIHSLLRLSAFRLTLELNHPQGSMYLN